MASACLAGPRPWVHAPALGEKHGCRAKKWRTTMCPVHRVLGCEAISTFFFFLNISLSVPEFLSIPVFMVEKGIGRGRVGHACPPPWLPACVLGTTPGSTTSSLSSGL